MKLHLNILTFVYILLITTLFFFWESNTCSAFDVNTFIENFEKNDKQTVLIGHIDTMVIIRGNAEFHLGPGELTLFDFGWGKPSAMVYKGQVNFVYSPPDQIERYQLKKFTGKDTLQGKFESICFFYTVELDNMPDTSSFTRNVVDKKVWEILENARDDAFDHLKIYMPVKLIGDIISEESGTFFYADFKIKKFEHLVFREDPYQDDHYRLYKLRRSGGHKTFDVYSGYSPANDLVSQRGLKAIDITHYKIDSQIKRDGEMLVKCRIDYVALKSGRKFLSFDWLDKNKISSAIDSNGDTLYVVVKKDQFGFGLMLNKPTQIGQSDYIDIEYKCEALIKAWGTFYFRSQTYWYPHNIIDDDATYELAYRCPEDFVVISCGEHVESYIEDERSITKWKVDIPVSLISFNIGLFDMKELSAEGLPPVRVYYSKELRRKKQLDKTGEDVLYSLEFFNYLFGPCPFETIKVTQIPYPHGQGSPGLLHLTWASIWPNIWASKGTFEQFRAHEVSHQWWGHIVDNENYRDIWIIEGLAEYSGFMYYQSAFKNKDACENILWNWRNDIFGGGGDNSVGSKAGPIILGRRLNSSKSGDYYIIVYEKGAYIFHMLRYLLHDYKTDSDDKFINLLRDLVNKYSKSPITTLKLQELIEHHAGFDMFWFFNQWVYGIDIPEYRFSYDYEKTPEGKYQVTCHVKQKDVPDDFKMVVPLTVFFENGQYTHLKVWVDQPQQEIDLPLLSLEPKKIEFNTYDAVLCNVKYK